jgi:hypothetical protein
MEIVPFLIEMRVGVSDGRIAAGGTGVSVAVEETGVEVSEEDTVVGKTSNEKVQASSSCVVSIRPMISCIHLCCFIAFSLFTLVIGWVPRKLLSPKGCAVGTSNKE